MLHPLFSTKILPFRFTSSRRYTMSIKKDTWSASEYQNTASFVYSDEFTRAIVQLLDPRRGERIVDFGCGSGELTRTLMEIVGENGYVVGIDSSPNMIEKARQNGVPNTHIFDVQSIPWGEPSVSSGDLVPESYDAVFSNAALQWCRDSPKSVAQNAWKLLKPGGRFVTEMSGFGSMIGVRSSLHRVLSSKGYNPSQLDPWYFPSDTAYHSLLEESGFRVETIGLYPRMTLVPNGLKAWLTVFARKSILAAMNDDEANTVMEEVVKECETDMKDERGNWFIVSVRLRFKAVKPKEVK